MPKARPSSKRLNRSKYDTNLHLPPPRRIAPPLKSSNPVNLHAYTTVFSPSIKWVSYDEDKLSMSVLWTTQFPADMNDEADIKLHRDRMAQGGTGLALGGGTVLRYVEFSPGYEVSCVYIVHI